MKAAKKTGDKFGCAVLCKGGHSLQEANDLLYAAGTYKWFFGERINNTNTHGTGCTLSSGIASCLAKGMNMEEAIETKALGSMLDLGKGSGPMDHAFAVKGEY